MQVVFGHNAREFTGPLYDGNCMRQEFTASGNLLISVDIYFATYKRKNPGKIHVEVYDFRKRKLAAASVDATLLQDNSYREFGLGVRLVPGQKYELRVWTMHCRAGASATAAWGTKTSGIHFFFGRNLIRGGELTCRFNYEGEVTVQDLTPKLVIDSTTNSSVGERYPVLDGTVPGLVTVVVPHYKCERYLAKCLASLSKQSYSCMEVFVVDDGSPDTTAVGSIVESYRPVLPFVQFIDLPTNGGAPVARNAGATMASGEYLFFCDADVELYPNAFEALVRCLIEVPSADFAYGGFIWGGNRVPPIEFEKETLQKKNYVTTMSLLRRAAFPGWDETLKRHQDWDLWLTMVDRGSNGVCCGKYLFETPIREGSISTDTNQPLRESMAVVKEKHGL